MRSAYNLTLTEEEAVGLLHIVMMAPIELSEEQLAATEKLSHCCRDLMLRSAAGDRESQSPITVHGRTPAPAFPVPR
jgi:hypothetical protein